MPSGWRWGDKLYVSFRRWTPTSTDVGLLEQYRNKVQVHLHADDNGYDCVSPVLLAVLDDPGGGGSGGDAVADAEVARVTWWPRRDSGLAQNTLSPLLVVRVIKVDPSAGVARVALCR
jgi:hypothetical protein